MHIHMPILRHIFIKNGYNVFLRDDGINENRTSFNIPVPYTEITYLTDKEYLKFEQKMTDIYSVEEIMEINKRGKKKKQYILRN